MEKKQKRRKEKGITLVALVVTIIVLIILAGVTLNIVLDQNGIINKAQQATEDYDTAQREEQELLGVVEDYIEYAGKTAPIPEGYTKSQITTEDDVAEGVVIYEIPEGATVNWTDNEDEKGKNQSTITIGENTTNLQETVNQYVWIPVEDINSMVMCKSNSGESVCNLVYDADEDTLTCTTHPDTANDLVGRLYEGTDGYTTDDGNFMISYTLNFTQRDQTYDANSDRREPAIITGNSGANYDGDSSNLKIAGMSAESTAEQFLTQLKSDFTAMAKSVAKSGGFYISRYEVGANGESKKGQTVLADASSDNIEENYLGAGNWYGLYNTIRNINANKQMIWGCQYDQVIKFIGDEAQIGHSDRNLTIDHALAGQNELDCMKNIYDLEGNHQEWTAEATLNRARARRGSYYPSADDGVFSSASFSVSSPPDYSSNTGSSRTTLYL